MGVEFYGVRGVLRRACRVRRRRCSLFVVWVWSVVVRRLLLLSRNLSPSLPPLRPLLVADRRKVARCLSGPSYLASSVRSLLPPPACPAHVHRRLSPSQASSESTIHRWIQNSQVASPLLPSPPDTLLKTLPTLSMSLQNHSTQHSSISAGWRNADNTRLDP